MLSVPKGEAAGPVSEVAGVQLQLQASFPGSAYLELEAMPTAPIVAELFAVLSSILGFYQDTAGSWSRWPFVWSRHASIQSLYLEGFSAPFANRYDVLPASSIH